MPVGVTTMAGKKDFCQTLLESVSRGFILSWMYGVIYSWLFLCHRILCRAFCNTICPSDLVRAQKMERLSAQDYSTSFRQWKENKAAQRLSSRHVPQNLSVNADMSHSTDCIAEAGAVLSWPIRKLPLII